MREKGNSCNVNIGWGLGAIISAPIKRLILYDIIMIDNKVYIYILTIL